MNTQDNQGNGLIGGGMGALLGGGLVAALPNAPINYYMNRTQAELDKKRDDIYRSYFKAVKDMSDLRARYSDEDLFPEFNDDFTMKREARNVKASQDYHYARKVREITGGMLDDNKYKMNELKNFPLSKAGQALSLLYRLGVPITAALIGSTLTD